MSISKEDLPEKKLSKEATFDARKYYFEKVLIHKSGDEILFFQNNVDLKTFVIDELTSAELFALFKRALHSGEPTAGELLHRLGTTYAAIKEVQDD